MTFKIESYSKVATNDLKSNEKYTEKAKDDYSASIYQKNSIVEYDPLVNLSSSSGATPQHEEIKNRNIFSIIFSSLTNIFNSNKSENVSATDARTLVNYPLDFDGVLSTSISQGGFNDCNLIGSILSMLSTKKGASILSQAVKNNGDYVNITLLGDKSKNNTVSMSKNDVILHTTNKSGIAYATQDLDYAAVEAALESKGVNINPKNGWNCDDAIEALTGLDCDLKAQDKITKTDWKNYSDALYGKNPTLVGLTVGHNDAIDLNGNQKFKDIYGSTITLYDHHAYGVVAIDTTKNTISLRNPSHGGYVMTFSLDEVGEYFNTAYELKEIPPKK